MKSKERPWALTKEDPIHEVKKEHEGPKSQKKEKERNNNNKEKRRGSWSGQRKDPSGPEDMQQEEGSHSDQRICSKMYVHISNKSH